MYCLFNPYNNPEVASTGAEEEAEAQRGAAVCPVLPSL